MLWFSYQSYSDFFTVLPPSLFLLLLSFVQWWVHRLGIFSTAVSYCLNPFVLCFSLLVAMPLIRIIFVWKFFFIHTIRTILKSCLEIKDEIPWAKNLISLNNNFIIAFEEIVIFKFTTKMTKKNLKNFHRKKWENKCLCINDSFIKRQKTPQSIKKRYDNPKRSIFWKEKTTGTVKKSRRGHKWRTTKRYEKIQKGFKWRIYSILPICNFFWHIVFWKME